MKTLTCLAVVLAINFNLCSSRSIPQEVSTTPPHSQPPPSVSPVQQPPQSVQHSVQPPPPSGYHQSPSPPGFYQPPPSPPGYYQQPSPGYYRPNSGYPYSSSQYQQSPFGLDPKYLLLLNGGLTGGGIGGFGHDDNPLGTLLLLNQLGGLGGGFAPYQPNTAPWGCSLQFGAVNCPNLYPGQHYSTPAYPQHPPPGEYQPPPAYQPPPPPAYQPPPPPAYQPPPPG